MKHTSQQVTFEDTLTPDLQYTNVTTISSKVYARARRHDGSPVFIEQKYAPTHYIPVADASEATHQGFDGTALVAHQSKSLYEAKQWIESTRVPVYGDIQPEYMLLGDSYGARDVAWDIDRLYIWNLDIETDSENGYAKPDDPFAQVISITVRWRHMGKMGTVVYGLKPYTPVKDELYILCESEVELFVKFLDDFRAAGDYPDIVTGWNNEGYDMPYLINRAKLLLDEETWVKFSPYERVMERRVTKGYYQQNVVDIRGIAILDYMEMYKKFILVRPENYRLDHIAHIELKKRKVSYAEFKTLRKLYKLDPQKFIEYNIVDVELVDELDEKLKLIELVCALAYSSKANFVDCFKQVRLWDIMIYHRLRGEGKQIPPRRDNVKSTQYAGGYVKEPIPGFYKWVCSFDVASMYPHIIREWNLSPETKQRDFVGALSTLGKSADDVTVVVNGLLDKRLDTSSIKAKDLCLAANGILTERHREGFLPNMLKTLYDERVRFKKMQKAAESALELEHDPAKQKEIRKTIAACENQQKVRKVNLNSAYGAMGSAYFRFYDVGLAEAVTVTGQMVIRWIARDINTYLNRILKTTDIDFIIASDTDSVYMDMSRVVALLDPALTKEQIVNALDAFCAKKIQPLINKGFEDIADYLNVALPCMTMIRDVIADNCIWTGKKHYAMNVYDSEGVRYEKPKLKVIGLEIVKSSTPAVVRQWMKDALGLVVLGKPQDEMWKLIAKCEKEFFTLPFEDVAFPRSANDLAKYEAEPKGAPIQVSAALAFNRTLVKQGIAGDHEMIQDGDKIKFAYLRQPNPFKSHVMGSTYGCPPEWKIEQYIDYQTQFEKSFLAPIRAILDVAKWTTVRQPSVFD